MPSPDSTATNVAFGAAVERRRSMSAMSLEDLARSADLHAGYLSKLESGRVTPRYSVIHSLATALGIPAWELVRDAEDADPRDG